MQDKLHVLPLFSFVCHPCKFDLSQEQEKIILDVANNIEYNDKHKKSHIRTKTIHLFQDVPELSFLGNMILDQFYKFKDTVLRYENTDFRLTTSWITKTQPGEGSFFHNHNNCMYSGVFYFNNDEQHTALTFTNFAFQTSYTIEPTEWNDFNSISWTYRPKNNSCIYFPSHLPHMVEKNTSDKIRQSIAFNIMPIGNIGYGDSSHDYGHK